MPAAKARRVLIVDDNRDAANMLGLLLRNMGHQVRLALDGESALREATAFSPEVVFLDPAVLARLLA